MVSPTKRKKPCEVDSELVSSAAGKESLADPVQSLSGGVQDEPNPKVAKVACEMDGAISKKKPSFSREVVRCGIEGCSFRGVRYSLPRHTKSVHPGQKPRPLGSVITVLKVSKDIMHPKDKCNCENHGAGIIKALFLYIFF